MLTAKPAIRRLARSRVALLANVFRAFAISPGQRSVGMARQEAKREQHPLLGPVGVLSIDHASEPSP